MKKENKVDTSWEAASSWYDEIVGIKGHNYHKEVILPKLLPLLKLTKQSSLIDLGCGQGILERAIPKTTSYLGLDLSKSLIEAAKKQAKAFSHEFMVQDVCAPFQLEKKFSHAAMILSIQNMSDPLIAMQNVSHHLIKGGRFYLVLNHPCFRIPRQSSWGIEPEKKLQYRKIDAYLSPLSIPIRTHPGKNQETLLSFHYPLSLLSDYLFQSGFLIEKIEEWCSNKQSYGKAAKMENRARKEFPLFMAIVATKPK